MVEFIDKTAETAGTPINRANMMAVQGFEAVMTVFNSNGSITETNGAGQTKTTVFNQNGSISEIFVGEKTITKITEFKSNGEIEQRIE